MIQGHKATNTRRGGHTPQRRGAHTAPKQRATTRATWPDIPPAGLNLRPAGAGVGHAPTGHPCQDLRGPPELRARHGDLQPGLAATPGPSGSTRARRHTPTCPGLYRRQGGWCGTAIQTRQTRQTPINTKVVSPRPSRSAVTSWAMRCGSSVACRYPDCSSAKLP